MLRGDSALRESVGPRLVCVYDPQQSARLLTVGAIPPTKNRSFYLTIKKKKTQQKTLLRRDTSHANTRRQKLKN